MKYKELHFPFIRVIRCHNVPMSNKIITRNINGGLMMHIMAINPKKQRKIAFYTSLKYYKTGDHFNWGNYLLFVHNTFTCWHISLNLTAAGSISIHHAVCAAARWHVGSNKPSLDWSEIDSGLVRGLVAGVMQIIHWKQSWHAQWKSWWRHPPINGEVTAGEDGCVRQTEKKKDTMEKKAEWDATTKWHAYIMLTLQASCYTANLELMQAR